MKMHGLGLRELSWDVYRIFRFVSGKIFSYIDQFTFTYRHFTFLPFVLFRCAV